MDIQVKQGQKIVLGIIGATVALSVLTTLVSVVALGPETLGHQIIRLMLALALSYFLYQGSVAAKWITVVLYGLGGVVGLLFGLLALSKTAAAFLLILVGFVCLASAVILVESSSVESFFNFQQSVAQQSRRGKP